MAELLTGEPREHIARMWPRHLAHLAPEGNKMGQGKIDPDEGVVCNCGEVLGFPFVQDEADYVAAEPEQPDTSGAQTGEPDDDAEPSQSTWNGRDTREPDLYQDGERRCPDDGRCHHSCGAACFRVIHAGPFTGTYPGDDWPADLRQRHLEAQAQEFADPDMLEDLEGQSTPEPDWDGPIGDGPQGPQPPSETPTTYRGEQHYWTEDADGDPVIPNRTVPDEPLLPDEGAADVAHAIQASDDPPWDTSAPALPAAPTGEPKGVMPYRDPGVVDAEDPLAARVVVIDPTQPYGPLDVERQLLDIAQRLERGVHYQRYWEEREFAAESTYTDKAARARLDAEGQGGAKDIRDARVHVACAEEWAELRLCQVMVRAVRETMHNLRSLQTGYQTVARSVTESTRNPAGSRGRP